MIKIRSKNKNRSKNAKMAKSQKVGLLTKNVKNRLCPLRDRPAV